MSQYNIDEVITAYGQLTEDVSSVRDARVELAQLRAAAAERDELRAKANVSICAWCGTECDKTSEAIAQHVITCEKRPEHAMLVEFEKLINDLETSRNWSAIWKNGAYWFKHKLLVCDAERDELRRTVDAQAVQLKQAHVKIDALDESCKYFVRQHHMGEGPFYTCDCLGCKTYASSFAANAPAPEAERTTQNGG